MGAINHAWKPQPIEIKHYMLRCLDDTYVITRGVPSVTSTVVKYGLTKEEAEAWLKLLKED